MHVATHCCYAMGMRARGVMVVAVIVAALGPACNRGRNHDAGPAPSASASNAPATAIRFDACFGCRCCADGQLPPLEAAGQEDCHQCVHESTLAAYGITYAGSNHYGSWAQGLDRNGKRYQVQPLLRSGEPVRLALPPGTTEFGVQLGMRVERHERQCEVALRAAHGEIELAWYQRERQMLVREDRAPLDWVELELTCPMRESVGLAALWLSPGRAPRWRAEQPPAAVAWIAPTALPAPRVDGRRLTWQPPVPIDHAPTDRPKDVAMAVAQSPVVVQALGLRPDVDELVADAYSDFPVRTELRQRYRHKGVSWRVEGADLMVSFEDGFRLVSIDASKIQTGLEMPKGSLISKDAATRIVRRHHHPPRLESELALLEGRPVHAFQLSCRRAYVAAFTGAYTEGSDICVRN
jgi:hypothetical protein